MFEKVILLFVVLCLTACDCDHQNEDDLVVRHEAALAVFQNGQRQFKELVESVEGLETFDRAKPGLDAVIEEWRKAASALRELDPPSAKEQERFAEGITLVNEETEPSGKAMFAVMLIEEREAEIIEWAENFAQAGREVGVELVRLYGKTRYQLEVGEENEINFGDLKLEYEPPKGSQGLRVPDEVDFEKEIELNFKLLKTLEAVE